MANANILNTMASQLEVVLTEIQEINAAENDQLYGRVKATNKVEKISRYLLRWVLETQIGGNMSKVSANGAPGVLPKGTQLAQTFLLAGYITASIAFRLTDEQTKVTGSQQAIMDVAARQLAKGVVAQQSYDDVTFAQDGTGILTAGASAVTTNSMTFQGLTDSLRCNLLFEGMCVAIWDTTGAIKRVPVVGSPVQILTIDYDSYTVVFDQNITGLVAGDIIALQGMDAYGPTTLTSYSPAYPGVQGGSAAGGIGGDSFRHGYPYWCNTNSANYFYGKLKSTLPQLNPVRVNANASTIAWEHGLRLIAKVQQKRPKKELWSTLEGIAHSTQKAAVFELGMSISQKLMTGPEFGQSIDLTPSNKRNDEQFNFAGIKCNQSTRQDRSKIDFISFEKIGRAEAAETGPYSVGGRTQFEARDPATGQPITAFDWFFQSYFENVCFDNGFFARIDNINPPSTNWDA